MNEPMECIRQAAALIIHGGRVCLITSSSGRRWILPKGTLEHGQSPGECAAQEAWEEAGIEGRPESRPVARYRTIKWGRECVVAVYRLSVQNVADDWPERRLRQRRWLSTSEAIERIDIPEVQSVLRKLGKPRAAKLRSA